MGEMPIPAPVPDAAAPVKPVGPALKEGERLMPVEQVDVWRRRITAALDATKPAIEDGQVNVARYTGKYLSSMPKADECLVPTDFYYVESKRHQLFHRLPDVFVKPEQPGVEDAAVVFQAALNQTLGPKRLNVLPTVQQVIFDVLCPTGYGAVAVGYDPIIDGEVEVPMGVGPDGEPITETAQNIIDGFIYVSYVRPGDLIVDPDHIGLDFNKSPYVGQRFREDVQDSDEGGDSGSDDRRLTPLPGSAQTARKKQRTGYEIWYRAHLFDPDVKHPDKIRVFKVYDDDKEAQVIVRDHPHQRYANKAGKLAQGMRGYGIKPVTMRFVSDSWMAPSDCSMARNTADELSKGRTQMLQARDRNMPQVGYDSTRVDPDTLKKIERNEVGSWVGFNGAGADSTWPIQKGNSPKETYNFNGVAQEDLKRIWRMGDSQIGVVGDGSKPTATQEQITANAASVASEADRAVFLNWYTNEIAAEVASLMQLYSTEQSFVELVGADAMRLKNVPQEVQQQAQAAGQDARVLVPWNMDTISGPFSFSTKPNSQVYVDAAQEKKQLMDLYQFFANEPTVNRGELVRAIISRYGFDPSKMLQAPPPKESPAPQVSLSFKGDDLSPQMSQSPIVLDALKKLGFPIDPNVVATAIALAHALTPTPANGDAGDVARQTEHGGAAAKAEPLSKHAAAETGGMQGTGAPAPMGAGGHL